MLYNAVDYFNIEELLSEEEKLIMYSVREFVENEVIPIIGEHYLNATFPMELIPKMSELGLLGITLPTELGGAGANYTSYGLAMMELERGDSAIRSFASVQNSLVIYPIYTYGTEVQKKKWLPKLASGEVIGCFKSFGNADECKKNRRGLSPKWCQNVDY